MPRNVNTSTFFLFAALAFVTFAGIPNISLAQTSNAKVTPEQAQQSPAGKFIQDLGNQAISIIADKSLTQEQRTKKYGDILHDAFDLPTIGKFVLGRTWATTTNDKQQEFMKLFSALVVKMYGDRLNFYSGEGFKVVGTRQESDTDIVVNSQITHSDSTAPTTVDWRVRQDNGKVLIVDVVIEGVSQSVTQRQEYASIIQRNGGNIDPLLDLMRQRLQAPSGDENGAQ
jgi:phospholipid transport system substrate-binding protein